MNNGKLIIIKWGLRGFKGEKRLNALITKNLKKVKVNGFSHICNSNISASPYLV